MSPITQSEIPDRRLIRAVLRDRDEAAFRRLYGRYTPRLFSFLKRVFGGNQSEAEDAVQETWIRACGRLDRFRQDASFFAWLRAIGLNVARTRFRSLGRMEGFNPGSELPAVPPRADPGERIDIERAIALLPDRYRAVVVLHDVEGMTHKEIAEALGITAGTSKSRLFRARSWLQAHFGPVQEQGND